MSDTQNEIKAASDRVHQDKTDPAAWRDLATAYFHADRNGEAVPCYRQWAKIQPNSTEAHLNLAAALVKMGDRPGARKELLTCIQLHPGHEEASSILQQIGGPEAEPSLIAAGAQPFPNSISPSSAAEPPDPLTLDEIGLGPYTAGNLKRARRTFWCVQAVLMALTVGMIALVCSNPNFLGDPLQSASMIGFFPLLAGIYYQFGRLK